MIRIRFEEGKENNQALYYILDSFHLLFIKKIDKELFLPFLLDFKAIAKVAISF